MAAVEGVTVVEQAKVVMRSGYELLMIVLSAPYHVDLNRPQAVTDKVDLALADEPEFASVLPDCKPGVMPPFGNRYGLAVWVNESLTRDE